SLSLSKLLSCEGESGSARNSSRPRETFTAPAILPLFSTSSASRTSTIRVLPCATMSRARAGVIRGTAALAASIISFKFVVMCAPPTPQLYLGGGRPGRSILVACCTNVGLTCSACDGAWRLSAVRHVGPPICPLASSRASAALPFLPVIEAGTPALASTVCRNSTREKSRSVYRRLLNRLEHAREIALPVLHPYRLGSDRAARATIRPACSASLRPGS